MLCPNEEGKRQRRRRELKDGGVFVIVSKER